MKYRSARKQQLSFDRAKTTANVYRIVLSCWKARLKCEARAGWKAERGLAKS
jgi:hypothetical protein